MPGEAAMKGLRRSIGAALAVLALAALPTAAQGPDSAARLAAQEKRIAMLEADLAALRSLVTTGPPNRLSIGGPDIQRLELRARNSTVVIEKDRVTIDAKQVTINGITVLIDGNTITLDAPEINAKGAGSNPIKGTQLREN
jgi:type II secretory pathway pseudopilin PulG